ncbi:MAG: DUF262 domain-containing protein [Treponema sp.]|nr:DUF262 domain-containing protein [Treponema sp.]
MPNIENIITAKEFSLQDILSSKKYSVDFFQREYSWKKENMVQLVYDLTNAFYENYHTGDTPESIDNYNSYYMGPIVLFDQNGKSSIIDGQQRITSLTLLLIYLKHKAEKIMDDFPNGMIFSSSRGKKSFNIDIPERTKCLESLFNDNGYEPKEDDEESVINMTSRYSDINEAFPDEMSEEELILFVYWLQEKVILVKITATSDKNAYMIFETMNDRGLSLSSTDMLKGFILSKYTNPDSRKKREQKWKSDIQELNFYSKGTDSQFFQSWLRAQFAETIRQGAAGTVNQDFETIGERFHYWFRENYDKGLLKTAINGDIESFMDNNYSFYLKYFLKIKEAESVFDSTLPHVYYAACWGFADSLKYPIMLAALNTTDSDDACKQKLDIVAKFIDIFCVRRSVNFRLFSASSLRYTMCNLTLKVRNLSVDELKQTLQAQIDSDKNKDKDNSFDTLFNFRLKQQNKFFVKYYLARITSFVEEGSQMPSNFVNYLYNPDCKPYEIEHIWADNMNYHSDEFTQKYEFDEFRNKIGALMLLPNGSNQSYGGADYPEKMPHYIKENILAKSLCKGTYDHNPNFTNFVKDSNLPFKAYSEFKKDDVLSHCELYRQISELIWGKI